MKVKYPNGIRLESPEFVRGIDMRGVYYVYVDDYRLELWLDEGDYWGRSTPLFRCTDWTLDIGRGSEKFASFNEARRWLRNCDAGSLVERCRQNKARLA